MTTTVDLHLKQERKGHYEVRQEMSNGKQDWKPRGYALLKHVRVKPSSNGRQDYHDNNHPVSSGCLGGEREGGFRVALQRMPGTASIFIYSDFGSNLVTSDFGSNLVTKGY
jgi:hypothetical protein